MNLQGYGFKFGGVHSDTYSLIAEKTTHPLTPPLTAQTLAIPKRPGAWYFRTDLGPRVIQVDVALQSDTLANFRPDIRSIANWLDPSNGVQPLIFDNEPDKTYNAVLYNQGSQPINITQLVLIGRMSLFFLCPDPYAYGSPAPTTTIASGTPNQTISLSNQAETFPKITVTFAAAETEYKITHQESGKFVRIIYNFAINDVLVIDCNLGLIQINGVNQMPTLDINSDFFALTGGSNTLVIAPSTAGSTKVDYTPRYL